MLADPTGAPAVATDGLASRGLARRQLECSERVGRHFRVSLPMWTNGLRLIDGDGVAVDKLRRQARAACNIGGLERWGWIVVGDVNGKRRGLAVGVPDHTIGLTPKGRDALESYRQWAARPKSRDLQGALEAVLVQSEALAAGLVPPDGSWRAERPYLASSTRSPNPLATNLGRPREILSGGPAVRR